LKGDAPIFFAHDLGALSEFRQLLVNHQKMSGLYAK